MNRVFFTMLLSLTLATPALAQNFPVDQRSGDSTYTASWKSTRGMEALGMMGYSVAPNCSDPYAFYYYYAPDVAQAGMDALYHWQTHGRSEGRHSCWP